MSKTRQMDSDLMQSASKDFAPNDGQISRRFEGVVNRNGSFGFWVCTELNSLITFDSDDSNRMFHATRVAQITMNDRKICFFDLTALELRSQLIISLRGSTDEHQTTSGDIESVEQTKIPFFAKVLKRRTELRKETIEKSIIKMFKPRLSRITGWFVYL